MPTGMPPLTGRMFDRVVCYQYGGPNGPQKQMPRQGHYIGRKFRGEGNRPVRGVILVVS